MEHCTDIGDSFMTCMSSLIVVGCIIASVLTIVGTLLIVLARSVAKLPAWCQLLWMSFPDLYWLTTFARTLDRRSIIVISSVSFLLTFLAIIILGIVH